jgi:uncharacterized phage protein gp47/JayE
VGTQVKTSDGTQIFAVVLDTTNAAYQADPSGATQGWYALAPGTASVSVTVQNTVLGTGGNVLAGTITLVATPAPGIDTVTNAAGFTNGVNAESDASFKARFGLYLASLSRGTLIAVESAVLGVAQNLTCAVLENASSISGGVGSSPGSFVVAVDDGSGATPSATLAAVAAAVDTVRPVGSTAYTVQATVIDAVVVLTITCANSSVHAATVPLVAAAISNFIGALAVATVEAPSAFPYWRIGQIAFDASPNVLSVSAVTLNGGTSDIGGAPGTVVRVGSVSVN